MKPNNIKDPKYKGKDKAMSYEEALVAAQKAGFKFPHVIAAQFANETGYGTRTARAKNNFFNIKWNEKAVERLKTMGINPIKGTDAVKDQATGSVDYYMGFENPEEAFFGLMAFLKSNPRYTKAGLFEAKTEDEYMSALKKAGYAESENYEKDLKNIITQAKNEGIEIPEPKSVVPDDVKRDIYFENLSDAEKERYQKGEALAIKKEAYEESKANFDKANENGNKKEIEETKADLVKKTSDYYNDIQDLEDHTKETKLNKAQEDLKNYTPGSPNYVAAEEIIAQSKKPSWNTPKITDSEIERQADREIKAQIDARKPKQVLSTDLKSKPGTTMLGRLAQKIGPKNPTEEKVKATIDKENAAKQAEREANDAYLRGYNSFIDNITKKAEYVAQNYKDVLPPNPENIEDLIEEEIEIRTQNNLEIANANKDTEPGTVEDEVATQKALQQQETDEINAENEKLAANNLREAKEALNRFTKPIEPISPANEFDYNVKNYKQQLPIEALAYGALAIQGMSEAGTEIPLRTDEISQAIKQYAADLKMLSEQGMPVEQEAMLKDQLSGAYNQAVQQIVRASNGDANLVLGNMPGIQNARMREITAMKLADVKMQQENFAKYGKVLEYMDEFRTKKNIQNHQINLEQAYQRQQGGAALASSGFGAMIEELQYQRENGPGSANHRMMTALEMRLTGIMPGKPDDGTIGTLSYQQNLRKEAQKAYDYSMFEHHALQSDFDGYAGLTAQEQADTKFDEYRRQKTEVSQQSTIPEPVTQQEPVTQNNQDFSFDFLERLTKNQLY